MTSTQSCAECGTRAEPGQSFCDGCGAVLSWTDSAGARTAGAHQGGAVAEQAPDRSAAGTADAGRVQVPAAGGGPLTEPVTGLSMDHEARATGLPLGQEAHATAPPASRDAHQHAHPSSGDAQEHAHPSSGHGQQGTRPDPEGAGTAGYGPHGASAQAGDPGAAAPGPGGEFAGTTGGTNGTAPHASWQAYGPDADADTLPQPGAAETVPPVSAPFAPVAESAAGGAADPETVPAPDGGHDAMADRARLLVVPVSDPHGRPAPPSVAPVLPGRPDPLRPQAVRAPGVEGGVEGGVPCPWCATPNHADRHFCGRCAMPMTREEHRTERLPWWRRLFGARREIPWAGDRPRLRRTFDRVLSWLGWAIVLTLAIVLAVRIPSAVQATSDHFAKRAPVAPDRVIASHSYSGHKPGSAFDKLSNTWWGPGVSESGQGQWIEAQFSQPTRLLDLIITSGVSARADQLSKSALAHRISATITTADGKTTVRELTLDQSAGGQHLAFRAGNVTAVRFTIESSYSISQSKQVAIAEIEFFGPSHTNGS